MKKICSTVLVFILAVFFIAGCKSTAVSKKAEQQGPKYVFLFIGDGMGKQHVELARQIFGKLRMDELPVRGSVSTVNCKGRTTDSAASGTAFACGIKTSNGRLGIDGQGKFVESSAVWAKRQGRRAAILTTVGVNNATPAAFYAHVTKRGESKKIMEQFPVSKIDILAGASIDGMNRKVKPEDFLSGKAYQLGNVQGKADDLKGKGIQVIAKNDAPFFAMKKLNGPVLVYSPRISNLASYVQKSIELMQDCPKGFFMMAEGGHIDHGGHSNNGQYMLQELIAFDKAVGQALAFYKKHPAETLIVVSADHHTGGLRLSGKVQKNYLNLSTGKMKITNKDSAETAVKKLADKGIKCTPEETAALKKAAGKKAIEKEVRRIVDSRSGIKWITTGHTTDEVYLFAIGNSAEKFAGKQENSDVGAKLKGFFAVGK